MTPASPNNKPSPSKAEPSGASAYRRSRLASRPFGEAGLHHVVILTLASNNVGYSFDKLRSLLAPCSFDTLLSVFGLEDEVRPDSERLVVQRHWEGARVVPIPEGIGSHGGGDAYLLQHLFDRVTDDRPLGRVAGYADGVKAVSVGIAGNLSLGQELHFLQKINELRQAHPSLAERYGHIQVRVVALGDQALDFPSKYDRRGALIEHLIELGRECAAAFFTEESLWPRACSIPARSVRAERPHRQVPGTPA